MDRSLKKVLELVTARSQRAREQYLSNMHLQAQQYPPRASLSCGNLAHAIAACDEQSKTRLSKAQGANLAIVTAYNDMLSAHQPYGVYPRQLKQFAASRGASAQVAGGVPAMCDGITQGQPGMDMSLFSRDVIAMSTAVALSHNAFDGSLCLGICDKIVPGLLMGALSFGHLPCVFVPAGPMPSGLSNKEKHQIRQVYAAGKLEKSALLEAEMASYHSPGTCTFYGTANSNQLLLEVMGLQLPGSAFVAPDSPLRLAYNEAAVAQLLNCIERPVPLHDIVTPQSIINAVVALLASGGSTNHTIHLIAIARMAGIILNWQDFAELSRIVPLLVRIYPNGDGDVNDFQQAGGIPLLVAALMDRGLLSDDVKTVMGKGLAAYIDVPHLSDGELRWQRSIEGSRNNSVLRDARQPFANQGGLTLMSGKLGRGIVKTSALQERHKTIRAPARVFEDQAKVVDAFERGELSRDCVVVVRFQGPKANGMPELHKLTPPLGVLQDRGFAVALLTDGRMSGASGKVLAAIHVYPEAAEGGLIAKIRDGDMVYLNSETGEMALEVDDEALAEREPATQSANQQQQLLGRNLFAGFRRSVTAAEEGALTMGSANDTERESGV